MVNDILLECSGGGSYRAALKDLVLGDSSKGAMAGERHWWFNTYSIALICSAGRSFENILPYSNTNSCPASSCQI